MQAGYTVGIFGKHLNNGYTANNPDCPPIGVDRWFANGGGDYYRPSFQWASAGQTDPPGTVTFDNCSYSAGGRNGSCYSTSVIGNATLDWLRAMSALPVEVRKPFFAYVAVKAPHIQDGAGFPMALPAPWYNTSFLGRHAPRCERNHSACAWPQHNCTALNCNGLSHMWTGPRTGTYRVRITIG
eukprot:SAG31_NODE_676_length_12896_cov_10.122060_2_plen_184_part_00